MEASLRPVAALLALNADLFLNCLDGVSDAHALERPLPGANSIAFLCAHAIDARYFMARLLGRPGDNPLEASLGAARTIDDVKTLPTVAELRSMWATVAAHVSACLDDASPERLGAKSPRLFPIEGSTILDTLTFLAQHESYHLGQIALLRKGLGYGAMSYERRAAGGSG